MESKDLLKDKERFAAHWPNVVDVDRSRDLDPRLVKCAFHVGSNRVDSRMSLVCSANNDPKEQVKGSRFVGW